MKFSKSQTKLLNTFSNTYNLTALKVEYGVIYEGFEVASNIYDALYFVNSEKEKLDCYAEPEKTEIRRIFSKLSKEMRT
tara:strand:+ start:154 stop:390 length:237 start_codon:yes stop_codon:yes gene_type:complete